MMITEIGPFLSFLRSVRKRTRAVAQVIPPAELESRPHAGAMSAGDLVRHIAVAERWMYVENVLGRASRYPGHGPELATGHERVLEYLDALHAETLELLAALTPEQIAGPCRTVADSEVPVWLLLRVMVEHEIHHRGQLYSVLGALGAERPPLFGLTEAEVRAASRAQ